MEPEKLIGELKRPEQMVEFPTTPIAGVGFTQILKATGVPWQLFEMGVTTKFAVIGRGDKLVVVKAAILPVPENPIPIKLLSFVQLYWVLLTGDPEKLIVAVNPLQTISGLPGVTFTAGVGLIIIAKDREGPLQVLLKGVTVMMV